MGDPDRLRDEARLGQENMAGADRPRERRPPKTPRGMERSGAVFERATRLARTLFGEVDAQVTLVDGDDVWNSRTVEHESDALAVRFAQAAGETIWVEDAPKDERFSRHPAVAGPPYLRF